MSPHQLYHQNTRTRSNLINLMVLLVLTLSLIIPTQLHASPISQQSTITYNPTNTNLANPERGFYRYIETRSSAPDPYNLATLRSYRTNEQITLLYCITYLDTFVTSAINTNFLQHIADNLATVREAGLKCILRFAYTDDWNNETPPFGDATKTQILAHLDQLAPILQANSDVIAVMQAGFIGVWGEWYYTDHFVDDPTKPWIISVARHADRLAVLERILEILPATRMAQVRYPHAKQEMINTITPIDATQAYANTTLARTGYHNDCFLASDTDFGTYRSDQIAADKSYMATETQYVSMGGESCNPNPPRSQCPTATAELAQFHYSYFNREYHPTVYNSWVNGGCIDEIQRKLGYHFVLMEGTYSDLLTVEQSLAFRLTVENQGYAAPFNPRSVSVVLRNQQDSSRYVIPLTVDPRRWWANSTATIDESLTLPANIPPGDYDLLLHLPAPEATLQDRAEYAIRFANAGLWEANSGYNNLNHTVTVQARFQRGDCNGDNQIDAGDLTALVQEIFDGDGDDPSDATDGTFAGTTSCDANTDNRIDAGDLHCTARLIFDNSATCEL